jgi:hypothetical protein
MFLYRYHHANQRFDAKVERKRDDCVRSVGAKRLGDAVVPSVDQVVHEGAENVLIRYGSLYGPGTQICAQENAHRVRFSSLFSVGIHFVWD